MTNNVRFQNQGITGELGFHYDSSNERILKYAEINGNTYKKLYLHGLNAFPLAEIDNQGIVSFYIYGFDRLIAKEIDTETNYTIQDHLGSTRVVLNSNNEMISYYNFDAFGNLMPSEVSEEVAYQYTGQEYDSELDLHNFRARFYDSDLMRFYAVDPLEEFASSYLFCGNNPIMFIDPTGENVEPEPDQLADEQKIKEAEMEKQLDTKQKVSIFSKIKSTAGKIYNSVKEQLFSSKTEETQFSASIDRELYSRVLAHPKGYQMTAPLISPFSNRVYSSKINFSEEIKSKSVGYWHTHGAAKGKYAGEEMSNPWDFNQNLKWSLLSTPSNEWLRAEYKGIDGKGHKFDYRFYMKDRQQWSDEYIVRPDYD